MLHSALHRSSARACHKLTTVPSPWHHVLACFMSYPGGPLLIPLPLQLPGRESFRWGSQHPQERVSLTALRALRSMSVFLIVALSHPDRNLHSNMSQTVHPSADSPSPAAVSAGRTCGKVFLVWLLAVGLTGSRTCHAARACGTMPHESWQPGEMRDAGTCRWQPVH